MISTIIIWIYILFLTSIYGLILIDLLKKLGLIKEFETQKLQIDILSLAGFCLLIIILSYISIFYKIGIVTHLGILSIAIIYMIINIKKYRCFLLLHGNSFWEIKRSAIVYYPLIVLIVLICAIMPISDIDTAYYHAQIIQWIEKYKIIPGLGNINPVFAYNQSIYLPSALFSFSFLNLQSFHLINSYLFLLLMIRLLYMILNNNHFKFIYLGLIMYFFIVHYDFVSSNGTDLPAFIFITYIVFIFISNSFERSNLNFIIIFLFGITVLTIKLSAIPIILLVIISFYQSFKFFNVRQLFILISLSVIFFAPWITRNIILSGYLIYPYPSLDVLNVDWKIPIGDVQIQKDFIKSWSIVPIRFKEIIDTMNQNKFYGLLDWENGINKTYLNMSFGETIISFLNRYSIQKLAFYLLSYSTILLLPFIIYNFKKIRENSIIITLWSVFYIGVLFWSISAPGYRFGSIYLILTTTFGLYILIALKRPNFLSSITIRQENLSKVLTKVFLIIFLTFVTVDSYSELKNTWLFQFPYKHIETISASKANNLLRTPKYAKDFFRCWNEPLPCIPCSGDTIKFKFRTENIEDGFKPK